MDPRRFDDLARAVAVRPSRRQVLLGLGGAGWALLTAVRRGPTRAAPPPSVDATPGAVATPAAMATYVSPSYHYKLSYDAGRWTPPSRWTLRSSRRATCRP